MYTFSELISFSMIGIWIFPLKGLGYGLSSEGSPGIILDLADTSKFEEFSKPGVPYNSLELVHEIDNELSRSVPISSSVYPSPSGVDGHGISSSYSKESINVLESLNILMELFYQRS